MKLDSFVVCCQAAWIEHNNYTRGLNQAYIHRKQSHWLKCFAVNTCSVTGTVSCNGWSISAVNGEVHATLLQSILPASRDSLVQCCYDGVGHFSVVYFCSILQDGRASYYFRCQLCGRFLGRSVTLYATYVISLSNVLLTFWLGGLKTSFGAPFCAPCRRFRPAGFWFVFCW